MQTITRAGLLRISTGKSPISDSSIILRRKNGFLGRRGKILEEVVGDIFYDYDLNGDGFIAPYRVGTKRFYLSLSNYQISLLSPKNLIKLSLVSQDDMRCIAIRNKDIIEVDTAAVNQNYYTRSYRVVL